MNYLFYLEPYAFLLRSNDKTVVYNTLNAQSLNLLFDRRSLRS